MVQYNEHVILYTVVSFLVQKSLVHSSITQKVSIYVNMHWKDRKSLLSHFGESDGWASISQNM